MKRAELDFARPRALQAGGPPERRGLARDEVRLLVSTPQGHEHARFRDLPRLLPPGTLLVVNASATLPASLPARHPALDPLVANVSTEYGGGLYLIEFRKSAAEPGPLPLEVGDILEIAGLPARREGRPVVAVGTTVVRALESAWDGDRVRAAAGFTRLMIHPGRPVRTVDGLLTGLHDPLASHLALLYAVAPRELVRAGYEEAVREGYLWHEFGDSHLILPG
ncbi:MAG TPA: S-adenosylmethionine:tRNA ribosyltransferase-isomerase [Thermoanaerobaculia bacterium]|nr:S-adenosylmethionine:tRNA ribosyltransferase-isomerase [Thermoanaerobaculia bacterium]